jgi:hypothetical protein
MLEVPLFSVATQPIWGRFTALAVVAMVYCVICCKAGILDGSDREGLARMSWNVVKPFRWRRARPGDWR